MIPSLPIVVLAGLLAGLAFTAAVAQEASQALGSDFDYLRRPSDRRLPLPENPDPQKTPGFVLPPVPKPDPEAKQLSSTLKVFVRQFRLTGNTVFSHAELAPLTAPYENRKITSSELQELRHTLTRYYVERGYINSGVIIPDQEVKDGIIELKVIEGELSRITIEGNRGLRSGYISDRIALGAGPPLNVDLLQERLQILLESPLIKRINAELQPGDRPGRAILRTLVEERSPYVLSLTFDNHIAPSIGGMRGVLYGAHRNLTGLGDQLAVRAAYAEGLVDVSADYSVPITRWDTLLRGWYHQSDSDVVEEPFNEIDVESEHESLGLSVSHPLFRTPRKILSVSATVEHRQSKTFLLGTPFSFSAGVQDGESRVTVIRLAQEWVNRSQEQVIAARSTFNLGIDAFGATINPTGPDGRFFAWLGQFQWARRVGNGQVIVRTDLQLAQDPLLPLEKFSVGGAYSVRGYRQNQLVRDYGFASSLEYRHPLLATLFGEGRFQIAPFIDVGGAWNVEAATPNPEVIPSVGIGIRWDPTPGLHAELYWGYALTEVDNADEDLQDLGIHFLVAGYLF